MDTSSPQPDKLVGFIMSKIKITDKRTGQVSYADASESNLKQCELLDGRIYDLSIVDQ